MARLVFAQVPSRAARRHRKVRRARQWPPPDGRGLEDHCAGLARSRAAAGGLPELAA
jgi:hypothetical protein